MHPKEEEPSRWASIEYARGIAALSVAFFHFTNGSSWFHDGILKSVGHYGYLGVMVFFVISGFVIPLSLYRLDFDWRRDSADFLLRRIVRLEPPYLLSCLLVVVLDKLSSLAPAFRGDVSHDMYYLIWHPLYLVPWVNASWLNPVYWSLAIEFQFYFFALIIAPIFLTKYASLARGVLALTLMASFVPSSGNLLFPYLPLFVMGFVGFLGFRRLFSRVEQAAWLTGAFLCCINSTDLSAAVGGLIGLALIMLPWPGGIKILTFFGGISYSLYLLHVPIGSRVTNLSMRISSDPSLQTAAFVLAMVLSILAAYIFSRVVERRSIDWSRSFKRKKPKDILIDKTSAEAAPIRTPPC